MSNQKEILMESIDILIAERLRNFKYNYYITGKITVVNVDGTYNLTYNGDTLTNIKTREGLTLIVGDIVYICIVNGNFSEKFIDCKRP